MSTSQEGGAALDELLDDALDEFPDSSYQPNTAPHIAFPTTEEETSGGGDAGSFAAKAALAFDPLARPIRRRKDQQGQHDEPTEMDRAQSRAPPTPGPSERDISDLKQGLAELMAELANAQDSDVSKMWQGVDGVGEQDGGPKNEMVGILQQLAESATRAASQGASSKQDGEGVNASIIDGLSEHLEQLEGGGEMQDVVDAIMRQLLAKDVLYQPLKEIRERYPAWLQENREKLSEEDRANYEQQYVCITKVCDVYEQEPDNFGKLMQLMQDMQGCGRPPQDIVDDLAPELGFVEGDGTDAAAALKSVIPDAGDCKLQ